MKLKQTLLVAALLASAGISNAALIDQNLALNKPVNASNGTATAAVDGNPGSRWETTWEDNQWIYVDLGAVYNLDHLRLLWEGAYTKHYQVCVAEELTSEMLANLNDEDATNNFATGWTVAADQTYDSFVSDQTVSVKGFAGRYVAINCIERGTQWGNSIYELEVYANSLTESKLDVTPDVLGGYIGTTVNFTAAGLNADGTEMDLTDAVWTVNGEPMTSQTVTFDTKGFYTVKVVAANGVEGKTTVGIFDVADNFVTPSLQTQQSENTTADASKAIDGDAGTMWTAEASGANDFDAWIGIAEMILQTENAFAKMKIIRAIPKLIQSELNFLVKYNNFIVSIFNSFHKSQDLFIFGNILYLLMSIIDFTVYEDFSQKSLFSSQKDKNHLCVNIIFQYPLLDIIKNGLLFDHSTIQNKRHNEIYYSTTYFK